MIEGELDMRVGLGGGGWRRGGGEGEVEDGGRGLWRRGGGGGEGEGGGRGGRGGGEERGKGRRGEGGVCWVGKGWVECWGTWGRWREGVGSGRVGGVEEGG